jgi:hypothetical protein
VAPVGAGADQAGGQLRHGPTLPARLEPPSSRLEPFDPDPLGEGPQVIMSRAVWIVAVTLALPRGSLASGCGGAFMRLQLFKSILFNAEDDQAKTRVHLTAAEIDTLSSALSAILPK